MEDLDPLAVVQRFCELYNDGTPDSYGSDRFTSLWSEDFVIDYGASAQFPQGRRLEGKPRMLKELERASRLLRDRHTFEREMVAAGETVVVGASFWATTAVHMPGFPAGSRIRMDVVDFHTVRDGLIVHTKEYIGPMVLSPDGDEERGQ